FDFFLDRALPETVERLRSRGEKDLRVWCAGCSSGEEAYMLMMLMMECLGKDYSSWNAGLLATDISDRVLTVARNGIYSEERIASLPDHLRKRYVTRLADGSWRMNDRLRAEITFRRFNLMNAVYPFKKPFHIIFCRNVMIYFDEQDKKRVVEKFHGLTEPEGFLFIGHSETLGRKGGLYQYIKPAIYQKSEAA
ncbi:MAG: chemotaxis protein CheR, partial [Deltaproteobacteria bacterium]|nr:chemotaxis protein CheR [Deltaproteobacteria bacterium]